MKKSFLLTVFLMLVAGCSQFLEEEGRGYETRVISATPDQYVLLVTQIRQLSKRGFIKQFEEIDAEPGKISVTASTNLLSCLANPRGKWVPEYNECEFMSQEFCEKLPAIPANSIPTGTFSVN